VNTINTIKQKPGISNESDGTFSEEEHPGGRNAELGLSSGVGARQGKIARLPWAVREILNLRLMNGWKGLRLLEWLNGLAEVKLVLAGEFGGREIQAANLTAWKKGGYQDWLANRQAAEVSCRLAEEALAWDQAGAPLTDILSQWVAGRLAAATREIAEMEGVEERWKRLREMSAEVARLRRGDQNRRRLEIEQERVEVRREGQSKQYERKLTMAFEVLAKFVGKEPEVKKAMEQMATLVRKKHPFDPQNEEGEAP